MMHKLVSAFDTPRQAVTVAMPRHKEAKEDDDEEGNRKEAIKSYSNVSAAPRP